MKRISSLCLAAAAIIILTFGTVVPAYAAVENPVTSGGVTTWDCVYFGHYPQSYDGSGPTDLESSYNVEQVKWRVLDVRSNKALLLSDQILDGSVFTKKSTHHEPYEEAPIFTYIETMSGRMFTSQEKAALLTKDQDSRVAVPGLLMLPSESIMTGTQYGFTSDRNETAARGAVMTDYAKYILSKKSTRYWLSDSEPYHAYSIGSKGDIDTIYNRDNEFGIRPIVILDLTSKVWYDAGTINSEGVVTDPVPAEPEVTASAVKKGKTYSAGGQKYTVTALPANGGSGTAAFKKAKNAKSVTVPATVKLADGKVYKVTQIYAKAFAGKAIRTVTIGKNVKTIKKNAFLSSNANKLIIKTKKLTKKSVKGSLKGSKIKTVKVSVGKKADNKKYVKSYKKIFTKKNAGKKVTVK